MSVKNSIISYVYIIIAITFVLFFGYKGFFIKSAQFDDFVYLTKTVDGQQENVIILPNNQLLITKTYNDYVEAALYDVKGQVANHYFFGLYRLGSFPFGLRYFKNPKAVYKVEIKIIKKEGNSFPKIGSKFQTKIVLYNDKGIVGKDEFRIVKLTDRGKKEVADNVRIMINELK